MKSRSFLLILSLLAASLAQAAGPVPVVVTDLDETVIDSSLRKLLSYRDAMAEMCGPVRTGDCGKVAGINVEEFHALKNRYDVAPLFDSIGLAKTPWRDALDKRAIEIYLSDRHLELDQAVPGAVEFIQAEQARGARLFFVSSRYEDTQLKGTEASLAQLGMLNPRGTDTIILRPRGMGSIEFKKKAFEDIRRWVAKHRGRVDLVMENEPENMNAMLEAFPGADAVFVDGAFMKDEPLKPGATHVKDFR